MPKFIGETNEHFENGVDYNLSTQDMTGRIYKPGKTPDGKKWLDIEGKPDHRIMVYGGRFYKVYETAEEVLTDWQFDEQTIKFHSPRIKTGFQNMQPVK